MEREEILDRFEEGAEAFLGYLDLNRNLSAHTLRAYRGDVSEFRQWLAQYLTDEPEAPQLERLREMPSAYVSFLSARGLGRTSLARKISALKTFFKFMIRERFFETGQLPMAFNRPKLRKTLPDFLSIDEVDRLLEAVDAQTDTPLKLRNRAIVELLFSSGIRVGELVGLSLEDVSLEEAEIRVLGKGGRERISFFSRNAGEALARYQAVRSELNPEEADQRDSPFFLNRDGTRLSSRSVHRLLLTIAKAAELAKPMHPHIFRHSFATHLLNNGVDLRVVQELLGHVSIRSTQIYTHVTTERLKRAYLKAHPRAQSPS